MIFFQAQSAGLYSKTHLKKNPNKPFFIGRQILRCREVLFFCWISQNKSSVTYRTRSRLPGVEPHGLAQRNLACVVFLYLTEVVHRAGPRRPGTPWKKFRVVELRSPFCTFHYFPPCQLVLHRTRTFQNTCSEKVHQTH